MANPQIAKLRKEFRWKFETMSERRTQIYKRDNYKCAYCGCQIITYSDLCDMIDEKQRAAMNNPLLSEYEYQSYNPRIEIENTADFKQRRGTLDHQIPLDKGGDNSPENLVTCCSGCNLKKNTKVQLENGYSRIANQLLEKFSKVKMSGTCWQVLMAVMRKLYGYGKKDDWIEYSQITEITGLPKSRISFAIKQLREYGIVTQMRNGTRQILAINKEFEPLVTQTRNSYAKKTKWYANAEPTVTQTRTTKETLKEKDNNTSNEVLAKPEKKEYGNKEINAMLEALKVRIKIADFADSQKWSRIYAKHCVTLIGSLGKEEFVRRLDALLEDPFKAKRMNEIRFVYEQIKGFKEPITMNIFVS